MKISTKRLNFKFYKKYFRWDFVDFNGKCRIQYSVRIIWKNKYGNFGKIWKFWSSMEILVKYGKFIRKYENMERPV